MTTPGFEGAEKILQIKIESVKPNNKGLRAIPQSTWQLILKEAKCSIINSIYSEDSTAYLLSESSLFVMDSTCIFKTCGQTQLLRVIPLVMEVLKKRELQLEFLLYTTKDFLFPENQIFPHNSWEDSEDYLRSIFPEEHCTILGDPNGDHVFMFSYSRPSPDDSLPLENPDEYSTSSLSYPYREGSPVFSGQRSFCEGGPDSCFLNLMMYDMADEASKLFFKEGEKTAKDVTDQMGLRSLFPSSLIDDYLFEPCGYSMNGLDASGGFYTIHVTPEKECSYASFETNIKGVDVDNLIRSVLAIFQPKRFTFTVTYHMDMAYGIKKMPLWPESFTSLCGKEDYRLIYRSEINKNNTVYSLGNYYVSH